VERQREDMYLRAKGAALGSCTRDERELSSKPN
jgi:hypothetical protein